MDRDRLVELAERCEARGSSRRLDTQVFILLDPDAQHIVGHKPGPFPQEAIYGPRSTFWEWALDESKEPPQFALIPAYTSSLDAAMTLVPEGWRIGQLEENWRSGRWHCYVTPRPSAAMIAAFDAGRTIGYDSREAEAATPALALTAAALRALANGASHG